MELKDMCISDYDFSAEERYVAGIILEYMGSSPLEGQKDHLREAAGNREALAALLAEAFSYTKADRITVAHPEALSEQDNKYRRIVDEYQKRLRPEIFSNNATEEFFRFLNDCILLV